MARIYFICCLILHIQSPGAITASDLYYWREYTGIVPPDALPGGKDASGRDTYIGEGYVHGHGLYVGQIYPGIREVDLPCYGVKTATIDIKILCTENPDFFHWIKTSAKTYEQDAEGLEVVRAGYDNIGSNGGMNVGRIHYQGYVVVGDVTPFKSRKGNVQLWLPFGKVERAVNFYELLVVNVPIIDPRMGVANHVNVTGV